LTPEGIDYEGIIRYYEKRIAEFKAKHAQNEKRIAEFKAKHAQIAEDIELFYTQIRRFRAMHEAAKEQ
jgi:hypothetical protein